MMEHVVEWVCGEEELIWWGRRCFFEENEGRVKFSINQLHNERRVATLHCTCWEECYPDWSGLRGSILAGQLSSGNSPKVRQFGRPAAAASRPRYCSAVSDGN